MAKVQTRFGELALLPLPARVPVRELLEWKTDLMTSFNGTEKAIQLRNHPRTTLTYILPETAAVKPRAYLTQYGALGRRWAIPLWCEAQHIGGLPLNTRTIQCNTELYDLRAGGLALLWQSYDRWELVEIEAVAPGEITLTDYAGAFSAAFLVPVRVGHIDGSPERSSNGYEAETSVRFEIEDTKALAEDVPAQFLGHDLYLEPGLMSASSYGQEITTRVDRVDYELGKVARRTPWRYNRDRRPRHVVCNGPAEVRAFRRWLMRRAGRFRPYWSPTFENDLRHKSTGTVTDKLLVEARDGLLDWLPLRNHIAVQTLAGDWLCRTVTAAVPLPGNASTIELTLDTALNVPAQSIATVSFLGLRRLDTDRVELNWLGNSVLRCTVNTLEIQP